MSRERARDTMRVAVADGTAVREIPPRRHVVDQ